MSEALSDLLAAREAQTALPELSCEESPLVLALEAGWRPDGRVALGA